VAAEFERPVLLFSGGKDSVVMLHLAVKAFAPARVPFPVMHVDTGHNFDEILTFRDEITGKTLELREPFKVVPPPERLSRAERGP
jgi:sulfate adenylyltransferase subunit 2